MSSDISNFLIRVQYSIYYAAIFLKLNINVL